MAHPVFQYPNGPYGLSSRSSEGLKGRFLPGAQKRQAAYIKTHFSFRSCTKRETVLGLQREKGANAVYVVANLFLVIAIVRHSATLVQPFSGSRNLPRTGAGLDKGRKHQAQSLSCSSASYGETLSKRALGAAISRPLFLYDVGRLIAAPTPESCTILTVHPCSGASVSEAFREREAQDAGNIS